jgi:transposase-like protein
MRKISYAGYRFPPEVMHQAIWLYLRFTLSFRDVEDLLAERGIAVSCETVRRWVNHFGPMIAAHLRKRRPKPHATWHLDEVYLKIDGRMVYLWRAVDAEGEVLDVLVQSKRDKHVALETDAQAAERWLPPPMAPVLDGHPFRLCPIPDRGSGAWRGQDNRPAQHPGRAMRCKCGRRHARHNRRALASGDLDALGPS